jgi:hypothetical protein
MVAPRIATGQLVALHVREFDVHTIELVLVRRRDDALGPVTQALWAQLAELASQS